MILITLVHVILKGFYMVFFFISLHKLSSGQNKELHFIDNGSA